jgi:hypothetical protein
MPKITAGSDGSAIRTALGAHHYRFVGIEVLARSGVVAYDLVRLGEGNETSTASQPHDITLDRCYVHGLPGQPAKRGVAMNGSALAVVDSTLSEFKDQNMDTQAIHGFNGPGPFKIVNNYLESAGENIMFGGADPAITNMVPADIEIRGNWFYKPTAWRGQWAAVKNLFELKNARRVLVEGNVFENNWQAAQAGWAIQFTVRNQDGGCPWCVIEDVTFRKNIIRHAGSGLNVLAADDPNRSALMKRMLVQDNLWEDINGATWGGTGRLFQMLGWAGGSTDFVIEHNTGFQTENISFAEGTTHTGFVFRNNLTPRGNVAGFTGNNSSEGSVALQQYFPGAIFAGNVIVGGNSARYPSGNFFPATMAAVGFVNASGDYRLAPTSPYIKAGTDGRAVGADIAAVLAATAGAISGSGSVLPPGPAAGVPNPPSNLIVQ